MTQVLSEGGWGGAVGAVVLACLVEGKHPGLAVIGVLIRVITVIVSG